MIKLQFLCRLTTSDDLALLLGNWTVQSNLKQLRDYLCLGGGGATKPGC